MCVRGVGRTVCVPGGVAVAVGKGQTQRSRVVPRPGEQPVHGVCAHGHGEAGCGCGCGRGRRDEDAGGAGVGGGVAQRGCWVDVGVGMAARRPFGDVEDE